MKHFLFEDKSKWQNSIIKNDLNISDLYEIIHQTKIKTFFVLDKNEKFFGVITEGDLRRYFIANKSFPEKIFKLVNQNPLIYKEKELKNKQQSLFKDLRKEVETGANGTQKYVIKKGNNKGKIANVK